MDLVSMFFIKVEEEKKHSDNAIRPVPFILAYDLYISKKKIKGRCLQNITKLINFCPLSEFPENFIMD